MFTRVTTAMLRDRRGGKGGGVEEDFNLHPNAVCYNIVIHALVRSRKMGAADRV